MPNKHSTQAREIKSFCALNQLTPKEQLYTLNVFKCILDDGKTSTDRYVLTIHGKHYRSKRISPLLKRLISHNAEYYELVKLSPLNAPFLIAKKERHHD